MTFFYSLTFSSIQAETVHGTIDRLAFDKSLQRAQRQKNIVPKFFNPNFWLSNTIMPLLYLREKELLIEYTKSRVIHIEFFYYLLLYFKIVSNFFRIELKA